MARRQKKAIGRKKKPTTRKKAAGKKKSKPAKKISAKKKQEALTHPLIGKAAPNLKLNDAAGITVDLKKLVNSKTNCILYFYPKDDTPGCTQEACDFRDTIESISAKDALVIGVSPDSVEKHKKFEKKYNLNFHLLSDPERKLIEQMKVWQKKRFMGREYMGVVRSTFLFHNGKVSFVWQPVRVKNHVEDVLNKI